jgi:HBS1 N-terminus
VTVSLSLNKDHYLHQLHERRNPLPPPTRTIHPASLARPNMSRHRIKSLEYDDDFDEEDEYGEEDPQEQAQLEEYTNQVLNELRTGQPPVTTASRQEVQEALWHYYNDVAKSVNYLRGMFLFSSSSSFWSLVWFGLS